MELISAAISRFETNKRTRRFNHLKSNFDSFPESDVKEEWLKAYELQQDAMKNHRNRRSINYEDDNLETLMDEFKKARDTLYNENDWSKYNLTDQWSNLKDQMEYESQNKTYKNDEFQYGLAQNNCTKEIGISATIFGAMILLAFGMWKLFKNLSK